MNLPTFESSAKGDSPLKLASDNLNAKTADQAELIQHLSGAKRTRRNRRLRKQKRLSKRTNKLTKRHRHRGKGRELTCGGALFTTPSTNPVSANSKYQPNDTIKSLLTIGAQHRANSAGDLDGSDPTKTQVYSSANEIVGARRTKRHRRHQ